MAFASHDPCGAHGLEAGRHDERVAVDSFDAATDNGESDTAGR